MPPAPAQCKKALSVQGAKQGVLKYVTRNAVTCAQMSVSDLLAALRVAACTLLLLPAALLLEVGLVFVRVSLSIYLSI